MEDNNIEKKPNYKIWHTGKDQWDKVVDEKFYAENDDAAYTHLIEFENKTPVIGGKKFYWSSICYTCCVDENGDKSPEFDIEDRESRWKWHKRKTPWWKKMWEEVSLFFGYYFIDRPRDLKYWMRDLVYLLKNKEAYSNQWNLDWHLLESIERNVPSLIENSHAMAFIDEAIIQMHGDDPGFDLDKYHRDHYMGYSKDIEELAMKIQRDEYSNLLLHVKLYKYYAGFGNVDFSNPDEVEFDKAWRHTLPVKPGTYDEISDYKKLVAMAQDEWCKIWDWMKMHGQKLND